MLECTNLTKSYKKKCVVNNLSFSVERGEIFAFLGSNGGLGIPLRRRIFLLFSTAMRCLIIMRASRGFPNPNAGRKYRSCSTQWVLKTAGRE